MLGDGEYYWHYCYNWFYVVIIRSFKQAEVFFQKGSLLTNQSRYLVCPKWKCNSRRISRVLQN